MKNKDYFPLYKNNKDFKPIYKETMEKKIIGYKLIRPEYEKIALKALGLQSAHEPFIIAGMLGYYVPKIKELGIMDWFEPVYEEEFKVGDWVVVKSYTQSGRGNAVYTDNHVAILEQKRHVNTGVLFKSCAFVILNDRKQHTMISKDCIIRKATKEEIEAATVIKIKGYKAQVNYDEGTVKVGCQTFDYDDVRSVIKVINAGLVVEDSDQIKKLWDKIK